MKRFGSSYSKNMSMSSGGRSQKKISSFFSKVPKNEDTQDKNDEGTSHWGDSEGMRKRKRSSEGSVLQELPPKVIDYIDITDQCQSPSLPLPRNDQSIRISRSEEVHRNKTVYTEKHKSSDKSKMFKENVDVSRSVSHKPMPKNIDPAAQEVLDEMSWYNIPVASSSNVGTDKNKRPDKSKKNDGTGPELTACRTVNLSDLFGDWELNIELDLSTLQRCRVLDIKRESSSIVLTVEQEDAPATGTVTCSGFWKDVDIEKNDIVAIQANKEDEKWIVDNNKGFLVVKPDVLVSGTTIVGSLFCMRKAVLAEKFRKIESMPYQTCDTSLMFIGNLVHQLFQKALRQDVNKLDDVMSIMDSLLQSRDTTNVLYASEMSYDECRKRTLAYVPKVFEFIQQYRKGKRQQSIDPKQNFRGTIAEVCDIEENIWLPKLGVKGKIDVTVEVNIHSRRKVMPLEVKTGNPTFSLEHKGQVILYVMMMALTGRDTDSGLLLYLRTNAMQEIRSTHPERRDLILLRNTLASYFASRPTEKFSDAEVRLMELPEPINHANACKNCPYNTLCCTYLSRDQNTQLSESHPLRKISSEILRNVKPRHIDYVVKWISLLEMEESAEGSDKKLKDIWTLTAEKRETKGTCISSLKVIKKVTEQDGKYRHVLIRENINGQAKRSTIPHTNFGENEYVIVSTDDRINISPGYIIDITEVSVILLLDRDITKHYRNSTFHVDKYSSSALNSFNLVNVGGLLADNDICSRLRDIVIDRKPTTFVEKLPRGMVTSNAEIFRGLNENQQRAIIMAVTANDYILIKGMPGTGKTQTLVALIKLLYKIGSSVIVTAHTNSAVDNILIKLMDDGVDFLRLGSIKSIHRSLKSKSERYATAACHTPESLEALYSSKNIVGVTCYGANHMLLGRRTFDVCIVDESTQVVQPTVLRPLYSAKKFVLAGDPDQLPPVIKSKNARKLGADESLFTRLDNENNTANLTTQYRMNRCIMELANKLTYCDNLKAGNRTVENATFDAPHFERLTEQERWLQKVLSQRIRDSVMVLNTGPTHDASAMPKLAENFDSDQMYSNIWEAALVVRIVKALTELGVQHKNIGVIAPYRNHVALIRKFVHAEVEVNTVDQYQGRDKEIILYSCARSCPNDNERSRDHEILEDHRRLTVAITRAKHKLILVADKRTVEHYTPFKKLFDSIAEKNVVNLENGMDNFTWDFTAFRLPVVET